jgi:hypothetical protein
MVVKGNARPRLSCRPLRYRVCALPGRSSYAGTICTSRHSSAAWTLAGTTPAGLKSVMVSFVSVDGSSGIEKRTVRRAVVGTPRLLGAGELDVIAGVEVVGPAANAAEDIEAAHRQTTALQVRRRNACMETSLGGGS